MVNDQYNDMKKLKIVGGILAVVVGVILSCETDGEMEKARRAAQKNSLPAFTTNAVTTFTSTTATLGGNITNAGTPEYTGRGVVYATTQNPTTDHQKITVEGSGTGNFSTGATGLTAGTKYYVRAYVVHAEKTVYGNEVEFTTSAPAVLPTLTTNAVTTFTSTTATLGGTITNAGTPAYTERGVCYATTQNPTTANNKTPVTDSENSNFSTGVTGLTPSTTYYVKAYAIHTDGTVYGNEVSFTTSAPSGTLPTLTTNAITAFTATSATLGGNITNAGTPEYYERGVVFFTSQNPTTEHNKTVIAEGSLTGNFSTEVNELMPNTQYYVRAYAINTAGTAYGNERSFTTSGSMPALTTLEATGITATGATLGGNITDTGAPPYSEKGVCYSTSENPTIDHNKTLALGTGTGNFSIPVSALSPKTTYYVRAYAINLEGVVYGEQVSFTTSIILPSITTCDITNITTTGATLCINITNSGTPAYSEAGVCYSTTPNPETSNNKAQISGSGTGSFNPVVSGLDANTTYYVRAYAIHPEGTEYGAQVSFTTSKILPTLTTNSATNISYRTATLGGNITFAGAPVYTERGVCYATSQNPTIANNKTIVPGTGTGNFSTDVSNLISNTTYYVQAYAIQSEVTVYGAQVSFTTNSEPEMVSVQGGTFRMGCTEEQGGDCNGNEHPIHEVTLSSFGIGKYEVTQAQWEAVMGSNPSSFNEGGNYPVDMVSWEDIVGTSGASEEINGITYYANGFIYKLNQLSGKKYRLPTEAEWEYAARGGNKSEEYKYSGSNNIDDVAWYNGPPPTKPVGTKAPNELDIYDMSGNVGEWCSDWFSEMYYPEFSNNPMGPTIGSNRVCRGGNWNGSARGARVSYRGSYLPHYRNFTVGFRLAISSE